MAKTANSNTTCTLQLSSKNQKPNENSFEVTLIEAIDESLGSFKSLNKQEIYSHLENAFGIKKQEIPYKIEEFADAMEQMFGIPDYVFTPRKGAVFFKEYVASLHTFSLNLYS